MKIGVLSCGPVARDLVGEYGEYDRVFRDWLGAYDPSLTFDGYDVHKSQFPDGPDAADAWILSGSKYGVYEEHDWIEPLKAFIRDCVAAEAPMIGVCFGHQIMAEALGGKAEKWSGGWNLGPKTYATADFPDWTPELAEAVTLHAIHQDQVTTPPPDATVVMRHDQCAAAALVYGDMAKPYGISIQPHPEFSDEYTGQLIELRRGNAFPEPDSAAALGDLGAKLDRDWAAAWFLAFLKQVNA